MSSNDVSWLDMILQRAGFAPAQVPMAAAIVHAESSINPLARNPSGATGLFQVMPATARQYGYNPDLLTDPLYNAQAAYAISAKGTDWGPWSTYLSGAYRRFLGGTAAGTGPGGNPGGTNGAGAAGRPNAGSGAAAGVVSGSQHPSGDWGALWSRIVAKFWRIIVAYAGLAMLASYGLTRPLAWAIVAIAALARVGGLGPAASAYASKLFSGG